MPKKKSRSRSRSRKRRKSRRRGGAVKKKSSKRPAKKSVKKKASKKKGTKRRGTKRRGTKRKEVVKLDYPGREEDVIKCAKHHGDSNTCRREGCYYYYNEKKCVPRVRREEL